MLRLCQTSLTYLLSKIQMPNYLNILSRQKKTIGSLEENVFKAVIFKKITPKEILSSL